MRVVYRDLCTGGNFNNGDNAGLFYANWNNDVTNSNWNNGARGLLLVTKTWYVHKALAPRQK